MIYRICRKGIENMLPNLKKINSNPGLRNMFGSFFTNMICWKGNENIDRTQFVDEHELTLVAEKCVSNLKHIHFSDSFHQAGIKFGNNGFGTTKVGQRWIKIQYDSSLISIISCCRNSTTLRSGTDRKLIVLSLNDRNMCYLPSFWNPLDQ